MPLAEAAGARIYFESHGSGEPLLLIAGFGSNTTVYWANIPELARHFRVIAIDPRGSGRSDAPPGPYTMSQLAEDCRAVLDACGVDAAHVAGASMGGMIAQHLALRFPGRVRGLVLACTTPGLLHHVPPPDEAVALFMEAAGIADPAKAVRATYPLNYSDAYAAAHDAQIVARALANEHLRSTPEGRAAQLAAVQGHDTYDRLGELAAPTLVLHGERDGIMPVANGRTLAARIPAARLITWPEGGHLFFVEFAREVDEAIIAFLRDGRGAATVGASATRSDEEDG